ncbi:HEAT repeat domain-containing protein [Candidatus Gracilibacteria bacterium]|nr:HEAT repeat domain-containing protein [Candidatus Gracilibacteria bacterium]
MLQKNLLSRSLDQLKRQARDLLRGYRAGDQQAQTRFLAILPLRPQRPFRLADALFVVAREQGFASWPRLLQAFKMQNSACRSANVLASTADTDLRPEVVAEATVSPPTASQSAILSEFPNIAWRKFISDCMQALARHNQASVGGGFTLQRTDHIIALAQADGLAALLAALQIPARDIKTLRASLLACDHYTTLIDALLIGVTSPNPRIRFLVAQAMDHFADERCVAALRALMHDPVPRVRWAAIHSLQCDRCKLIALDAPDDTLDDLIALALYDPSIKVRRVATYELSQRCEVLRVQEALQQLAMSETDAVIQRFLRRIGMTVVCLAPLLDELNFLVKHLTERGYVDERIQIGQLIAHRFAALNLMVAPGSHRKTQFGVQKQYLLDRI